MLWYVCTTSYLCVLQFLMHAYLIHVNTKVGVPKLPTGFNADAAEHIQETPVLVGIVNKYLLEIAHARINTLSEMYMFIQLNRPNNFSYANRFLFSYIHSMVGIAVYNNLYVK